MRSLTVKLLTCHYNYTLYYRFTLHICSPVIRDGGRKILKLGINNVHVVDSVPHGIVVEYRASMCLIVDLIVVVPPTTRSPHIAIVSTSASATSVIEAIPSAIILTSAIVPVVITSSSSLLTLLSLSPKRWRRGRGLCLVNTRLSELLLQVCLLPSDPLSGLPLRVEVALVNFHLEQIFHLNCDRHSLIWSHLGLKQRQGLELGRQLVQPLPGPGVLPPLLAQLLLRRHQPHRHRVNIVLRHEMENVIVSEMIWSTYLNVGLGNTGQDCLLLLLLNLRRK